MAGIFSFNVGELARPATVLIERISDAVGGIAKPYQVERLAKSESKAAMIRAESDIEISDLRLRAANRFINEEMSKQANMESITAKAIPHLKEDSSPESMNDDWLTNFFEKCRIVSDSNMQDLWARILAGEANAPGAFSRKTVNLMADLEQRDAEIFRNLCRFSWTVPGNIPITPVIFDYEHEIYGQHGISFDSCTHLDALGLVLFEPEYKLGMDFPDTNPLRFSYHGRTIEFDKTYDDKKIIPVGAALFTKAGIELALICQVEPEDSFFEYVYGVWERDPRISVREP